MKKLIYLLIAVLSVTVISCGDDDPVIPRDRDIQFNTFELFHIAGATPLTSLEQCGVTIHRQNTTADLTIKLSLDGSKTESFTLTGIALNYDVDKNIYTAELFLYILYEGIDLLFIGNIAYYTVSIDAKLLIFLKTTIDQLLVDIVEHDLFCTSLCKGLCIG